MARRGRKKLVEKIAESINIEDERGVYIIIYDYPGGGNPKELYYSLKNLRDMGHNIEKIQKSVLMTDSLRTCQIVKELAKHYKAKVHAYKIEKEV